MKPIRSFLSLLFVGLMLTNCTSEEKNIPPDQPRPVLTAGKISHQQQVEYGGYLVGVLGCNDCHSPKVMTPQGPAPDPARLLSGHPADEKLAAITDPAILKDYVLFNMGSTSATGPWGTSFAANLTPDNTGLGNWTIEHFEKAMREGKYKGLEGTRSLLPPMPWPGYSQLSDDDLAAIWAYLRSIPPVKNVVPMPVPPAS